MYRVTLVNLSADARLADTHSSRIDRSNVSADELRDLLRNFSEIDRVEAAAADPEIRVQATFASWLVTAGPKNLILHDAVNREAAGHSVGADDAMAEIDGTASAARVERLTAAPFFLPQEPEPLPPLPQTGRRRVRFLAGLATLLALSAAGLRVLEPPDDRLANFRRLRAAELQTRAEALAGVYLVGTQPGQHGLVLGAAGEVRLFEFRTVDAPRVVHATGVLGEIDAQLCIATDQPGGVIVVRNDNALEYCGETYTRLQ